MFDDEQRDGHRENLQVVRTCSSKLMQKLVTTATQAERRHMSAEGQGQGKPAKFEITDKSLDFLGFKTLKDLLGSLGQASFGAHDTRDLSTGVESSGSSKQYEFGDTLNLDVSATLFSAFQREGVKLPLELEYDDLHVHQSEYQSSCATVRDAGLQPLDDPLWRGSLHSGQTRGAGAGAPDPHAVSRVTSCVWCSSTIRRKRFGCRELARVQVGPYYTNTRDGLILAQRILASEKKDMKQIVMITDGKPSALTLDDGRIYKNAIGPGSAGDQQDAGGSGPLQTAGILINTFMLASDYSSRPVRAEGDGDVQGQGLFHDSVQPWPVSADGLT
ncbi:MAG: hypothetical protein QM757_40775 [Paludibaculum sp.]